MEGRLLVSVAQFDRTVRKLLLESQARLQRLNKNSIFRFGYPVDFDDITLVRKVIGEVVLHENLALFAPDSRPN